MIRITKSNDCPWKKKNKNPWVIKIHIYTGGGERKKTNENSGNAFVV